MLLAVNIGNSNIRFAVMEDNKVHLSWTIATKPYRTAGEFYITFQTYKEQYKNAFNKITKIVIGSVVPQQTQIIAKMLQKTFQVKPFVVNRDTPSAVSHHSNQMGTDLYANAVASHYLYPNQKKIIIDFGTALTLTGVTEEGKILGVLIAPGVITSLQSLVNNTAQLPYIELNEPKSILGMDTETCMQSGIIYGYTAMVEGLIHRIKTTYQSDFLVISTGGVGHIFSKLTSEIQIDDKYHTIKGLSYLYSLNREDK